MPARTTTSLKALAALTAELQSQLSLDDMMQVVVARAAELLGTDRTSLRLLDASQARLLSVCRHGRPLHAGRQEEFRVGEGLIGWIAAHAAPILAVDAEADPRFVVRPGMQMRMGSFLGVPLMEGARCIGVLSALHPDVGYFQDEHLQQLTLMAALCAPRIEAARLRRLARIDPLTGALNRRGFDSEFPEVAADVEAVAVTPGEAVEPLSVIMVDLDRFKQVNDAHGHAAGDEVLRVVTGLLASVLRDRDAIVRYGGEEFLLVLPHATVRGAESVAERARVAIERSRVATASAEIALTASFGVAQRRPGEAREALLRRADEALYRAKDAGRNRIEVAE